MNRIIEYYLIKFRRHASFCPIRGFPQRRALSRLLGQFIPRATQSSPVQFSPPTLSADDIHFILCCDITFFPILILFSFRDFLYSTAAENMNLIYFDINAAVIFIFSVN